MMIHDNSKKDLLNPRYFNESRSGRDFHKSLESFSQKVKWFSHPLATRGLFILKKGKIKVSVRLTPLEIMRCSVLRRSIPRFVGLTALSISKGRND